jgi:hypothetical protein
MTLECTLQLPVIEWSPRLTKKTTTPAPAKSIALENMSLNELLYFALTSAH